MEPILGQAGGDAEKKLLITGVIHCGQGLLCQEGTVDLVGLPVYLLVGGAAVVHRLTGCAKGGRRGGAHGTLRHPQGIHTQVG